jgi:hypothetical protein
MIRQETADSLSRGQEAQIADTLLYQLTETKGASIEHLKLLEAVVNLSRHSGYPNWGKDR